MYTCNSILYVILFCHCSLQKQINLMNKVSNNLVDQIQTKKDEWESEMSEYYENMQNLASPNVP